MVENIMEKGENAGYQRISFFSQCFQKASFMGFFKSKDYNKFLDWSKLKAHADDKIIVTRKQKFLLGMVENIAGKGENAGYQHFLLFPTMFPKNLLYQGRKKSGLCGKGLIKAYLGNSSKECAKLLTVLFQ